MVRRLLGPSETLSLEDLNIRRVSPLFRRNSSRENNMQVR
jgi:hypothetical protein